MQFKKIHWIILATLCLLALIFIGGRTYIHQRIDKAIKAKLAIAFGANVSADFRRSKIGFSENTLAFEGIDLFESHRGVKNWSGHIEAFKIYGFDLIQFIKDGDIGIDSVLISHPDLRVFELQHDSTNVSSTDTTVHRKPVQIQIQAIKLEGGKLLYDPDGPLFFSTELDFRLTDFDLDSISNFNAHVFDKMDIHLENLSYQFADSVYQISLRNLKMTPTESGIRIDDINLFSNFSTTDFPAQFGWRKPRLTMHVPSMHIDKPTALNSDLIAISQVVLDSVSLNIDKDNRFPLPDRWTNLPQEGLMKMVQKFKIDSILITNTDLNVKTIMENGDPTNIELSEIDAKLLGFQNVDSLLPAFTIKANSKLMDQASLSLVSVYKYGPHDPFTCNGSLGNTNLEFMDDYLQKVAGLKIVDGMLNRLDFEMIGNKYGTNGFVDFRYDNLQIHAVHKETGEDKRVVNFLSNMAGSLVFWQENPSKNQFRRGEFYAERDVRKGFISQWVEGLIKGIIATVSKVDPTKLQPDKNKSGKSNKQRKKKR